jgi:kinesin family member 22
MKLKMTGNDPSRMAESSAINKSLTTLGMVVKALNRNEVRMASEVMLLRVSESQTGPDSISRFQAYSNLTRRTRRIFYRTLDLLSRTRQEICR